MKHFLPVVAVLLVLTTACTSAPTPTPAVPTATTIPPTATSIPLPTNTATAVPSPTVTPLPGTVVVPLDKLAKTIPWLPLDKSAVPSVAYFGMNVARRPLDNLLVRQALAMSLDHRALGSLALSSGLTGARPASSFTPPETLGRDLSGQIGLAFDPAKAQDLLTKAGYPNGQGLPEIIFATSPGNPALDQFVAGAVKMWQDNLKVSVKIQPVPGNFQAYINALTLPAPNAPHIYFLLRTAAANDPSDFLTGYYSSPRGNYSRFTSAEFDRLIDQGQAASSDPARRQLLYIQAERILLEDGAAIIPVYYLTIRGQ